MEPPLGFEPRTYCLQNNCSTAELRRLVGREGFVTASCGIPPKAGNPEGAKPTDLSSPTARPRQRRWQSAPYQTLTMGRLGFAPRKAKPVDLSSPTARPRQRRWQSALCFDRDKNGRSRIRTYEGIKPTDLSSPTARPRQRRWQSAPYQTLTMGRLGFAPRKARPVDLQSTPFDYFGTCPLLDLDINF